MAYIDKLLVGVSSGYLFNERPRIDFYPDDCHCNKCGRKLKVHKTHRRTVYTLDIGGFVSKETILKCPCDDGVYIPEELQRLVPHKCTFGFDVMVYVGKALFAQCLGEQEIIKKLNEKNIPISDREISYLGKKFIMYLAIAHRESHKQLKVAMALRGGYILHLDGTCEGDSPFLFTGIDGIAEVVLDNIKLPSEKAERIIPFLKRIKKHYGNPLALVHDMGKGILRAVEEVFPDIRDFICHYHFLRDIGKDLYEAQYSELRNLLKRHRIRTLLRQRAKTLEKVINCDISMVGELKASIEKGKIEDCFLSKMPALTTYTLIHWALDTSSQLNGYGFPFDCTHLVFYQNLKAVYSSLNQITESLNNKTKDYKPFYTAKKLLEDVINDKKVSSLASEIQGKVMVFDKLREAMRIALPEGKKGLNDDGDGEDIRSIEDKVKGFKEWLESDKTLSIKDDYKSMRKQIDKYWDKLFADPIKASTPDGMLTIQPQRTNNILERLFRDIKRGYRKKSGTSSLSKVLRAILSDTPLIKNLDNEEYMKIILDDCQALEERFAKIDSALIIDKLKTLHCSEERISPVMRKIIKKDKLPAVMTKLLAGKTK